MLRLAAAALVSGNTTALVAILSAAEDPTSSPIAEWVQLVNLPLSILILYGFARGWFITGKEHQRVVDERNKEREERIKAQDALTEKVLPVFQENERTLADLVKTVERLDTRRRGP